MGILTRSSFFCTQRVEKDMILLELTVFKAAPQLSFAKLCDLLKHSRMQTCPNQSEETCIIFNQSGVELGLLAPCISRAFPPLENGTRANEWVLWRYHIVSFCQWDFFQQHCHDNETILQHRLTLWVLLVFSCQVCYKKEEQVNKWVYKQWIPNSYFSVWLLSLNYRCNLTLGQKLNRIKHFLQCPTQLATSLTRRFLLFAGSFLLRRMLTDHSFSWMLGRLSKELMITHRIPGRHL